MLTVGHNICYCNNIALGETNRTYRAVGARRNEAKNVPIHRLRKKNTSEPITV